MNQPPSVEPAMQQICTVCGLCKQTKGDEAVFVTYYSRMNPGRMIKPWDASAAYSKVCQFAKKPGCINTIPKDKAQVGDEFVWDTELARKKL